MSSPDKLRESRESRNIGYQTFIRHIRENKEGLFCFFEGKDSPYYHLRIKQVFTGNYFPIKCGNKDKVLKVFQLINFHRIYDKYKKAFFVDSDFDPPLHNPKIYETPCYSIENHYVSVAVFGEILKSEWGFSEVDEDYKRCIELYESLQIQFHAAVQLFNVWYACLIDKKQQLGEITGVNLDDKLPKGFVEISLDGVTSDYDFVKIQTQFPDALEVTLEEVNQKSAQFDTRDKRLTFRGKYELKFMLMIMDGLILDSKKAKKDRQYISKPIKYSITHPQAINQFSQYAETPLKLKQYIQNCIN